MSEEKTQTVKRWCFVDDDFGPIMTQITDGDYVLFSDYQKLQEENERLKSDKAVTYGMLLASRRIVETKEKELSTLRARVKVLEDALTDYVQSDMWAQGEGSGIGGDTEANAKVVLENAITP